MIPFATSHVLSVSLTQKKWVIHTNQRGSENSFLRKSTQSNEKLKQEEGVKRSQRKEQFQKMKIEIFEKLQVILFVQKRDKNGLRRGVVCHYDEPASGRGSAAAAAAAAVPVLGG